MRSQIQSWPADQVEHDQELEAGQYLFRVRYSGPEGSGSLKLVVRLVNGAEFQLAATDTLGRAAWSLQLATGRTQFIDHRREVFCFTGQDLRLAEPALRSFAVPSIPRMLLGRLPIELDHGLGTGESAEVRDDQGRRWSLRLDEFGLAAWTLWTEEAPVLWWTRQEKGGILSHRDGSQFRWRQVVVESLTRDPEPLQPPASYRQTTCDEYDFPELRQDQPPPAGDGKTR